MAKKNTEQVPEPAVPAEDQATVEVGSDEAQKAREVRDQVLTQIGQRIVGQEQVIELLLIGLCARGHGLFIGVPGLAKTLLISTLAEATHLNFNRIQFTPDLMPSDITGTDVLEEDAASKRREFRFVPGPVFTNILLADEINRTPPKTQAALLQAMQEREVTAGGRTYPLEEPFLVFATQNPIEQEGTYPLPEAQLDRFMFSIDVRYPSFTEEVEVVRRTTLAEESTVTPVISGEEVLELQKVVREVPVSDHVLQFAVRLVQATRPGAEEQTPLVDRFVSWGAGPRAGQFLILGGKARALLDGRHTVDVEDIQALVPFILSHRLLLNYHAEAERISVRNVLDELLDSIGP
ncbi:MAG: AAA family ATPase [Myxococcales bacterium]|nr:AAA family ATPase [Myxococcales bacterium]|tara:strand:+ start:100 stop:1149 length:1050 start_codon:yes stop_codon:yes gene_type:complete